MYQKIIDVSIWVFALLALLGALLFVSWNTAGAQMPAPTPVCTMTPDGELCTSSVAMTMTPTSTPVAPSPVVTPAGELTPFVPTSTPTVLPTPTATRPSRPTFELTPWRSGSNAHLPIIYK